MYIFNFKESNKKVVAGEVVKFNTFVKEGVKGAAVEIKDWRGDTLTIFWKDKNGSVSKLEKAKLAPGRFATFMVMKSDEDETATGLSMQWHGFKLEDNGQEIGNVLSGRVYQFKKLTETMCKVRMLQKATGQEDRWVTILFYDNENHKNASRASKVMENAGNREFAVSCGVIKEKTDENGRVEYECAGYSFDAAPTSSAAKETKASAKPATEPAPAANLYEDEP